MPLRKSHLYSSLWKSCDELRGGMDASQYKDYILTLLFMKYVSDKYAGDDDFADITVPAGGSFADMVALKGTKEIGEGINKVIGRLATANDYLLKGVIDQADFNDESKLGRARRCRTVSRSSSGSSRGSISAPTAPTATTSWATRTNTSSGLEILRDVLRTALADKLITFRELNLLRTLLDSLGLSEAVFRIVLAQLNHFPQRGNILHTPSECRNVLNTLQRGGIVFHCNNVIVKDQLNAEERAILEKFERDELKPATGADREMAIAPEAARNTFKKTRRVNLRVTERDFNRAHAGLDQGRSMGACAVKGT